MKRRQTSFPRQWLILDSRLGDAWRQAVRRLPIGSGILILCRDLPKADRAKLFAKLRRLARARSLTLVDEAAGEAARVHGPVELRQAGLGGFPLVFLSPMFPTRSHPDWVPLRRMQASALVRLANRPVIALGGMDEQRFRRVQKLGFSGWAAIDAWIRT